MNRPEILVVVPTLGERITWLRQTLASICSQDLAPRVRLVAPTRARLQYLTAEFPVELVELDERGLSRAINVGMSRGDQPGDFVTWLGDDDLLAEGSLRRTASALQSAPAASFVYGNCRYIDADGGTTQMFRPGPWGAWWSQYGSDLIPQPGSLIRRSAWDAVGGLDETYKHAMDLDLFLRLMRVGRPVYVARELASWRIHASSITTTKTDRSESRVARGRHAERRNDRLFEAKSRVFDAGVDRALCGVMRRIPAGRRPQDETMAPAGIVR